MKGEEAKKLADGALEELALALDDGHSESLTAFLTAMGRFHQYSLGNSLLIAMQRPGATRVAGYRAWQKLGRQVRQGERGIAILAPMARTRQRKKKASDEETEFRVDARAGHDRMVLGFRGATVFDIAQTDGRPLPDFAHVRGDPHVYMERLQRFVESRGIRIEYSNNMGAADGLSCGGTIKLRPGLPPAEQFSVLTHELAHEKLHRDDQSREVSRSVRETEAEAVAFVVCQAIGLDTNTAARDYIQLYQGDRKLLMASLEAIRQTAVEITGAIKLDKSGKRGAEQSDSTNHESSAESLAA